MTEPLLHIALVHPEIPQNTGNIGRLCVGLDLHLHLVHPLGFDTSDKAVRRAGLDYWPRLTLTEHPHDAAFWSWAAQRRVHLFSAQGEAPYTQCPFADGDVLVFGRESVGLDRSLVATRGAWRIPITGPVRSLNLANAVAVVAYGAMARLRPELFG